MNTITVTGYLANDPARRDTTKGVVAEFRVAVDDRPSRLWIDIETWGRTAGNVAAHLTKGRHVAVTGQLRHDQYHDRNNQLRDRYYITAERITYLDNPTKPGAATGTETTTTSGVG